MSYRTYVNNIQIFGNNEYHEKWTDYVQEKGIEINDGYGYEGYLDDFMEALSVMESIVMDMESERQARIRRILEHMDEKNLSDADKNERIKVIGLHSLFDLSNVPKTVYVDGKSHMGHSLFDELEDTIKTGYIFLPYAFYRACEPDLLPDKPFSTPDHFSCYALRPDRRIHVEAG